MSDIVKAHRIIFCGMLLSKVSSCMSIAAPHTHGHGLCHWSRKSRTSWLLSLTLATKQTILHALKKQTWATNALDWFCGFSRSVVSQTTLVCTNLGGRLKVYLHNVVQSQVYHICLGWAKCADTRGKNVGVTRDIERTWAISIPPNRCQRYASLLPPYVLLCAVFKANLELRLTVSFEVSISTMVQGNLQQRYPMRLSIPSRFIAKQGVWTDTDSSHDNVAFRTNNAHLLSKSKRNISGNLLHQSSDPISSQ
jgi:hypothetical protein